ncbi:MAG: hypothetical protein M3301_06230, partial [Chloroflexota bacterium]|nr:hypothetical protein [Chloroflexota bacterium]
VLEPRDVPWLWALGRRRGRRDFIIVRGSMRRAPLFELEAGDQRGWTGGDAIHRLQDGEWHEADWGAPHVRAGFTGGDPLEIKRFWDRLQESSGGVWRLSVRRTVPHLEVHLIPPDTSRVPADRLFRPIHELAEALGRGR